MNNYCQFIDLHFYDSFLFELILSYCLLCAYENISIVYAQYKFYIYYYLFYCHLFRDVITKAAPHYLYGELLLPSCI